MRVKGTIKKYQVAEGLLLTVIPKFRAPLWIYDS
jgi:hypothetical protein